MLNSYRQTLCGRNTNPTRQRGLPESGFLPRLRVGLVLQTQLGQGMETQYFTAKGGKVSRTGWQRFVFPPDIVLSLHTHRETSAAYTDFAATRLVVIMWR